MSLLFFFFFFFGSLWGRLLQDTRVIGFGTLGAFGLFLGGFWCGEEVVEHLCTPHLTLTYIQGS